MTQDKTRLQLLQEGLAELHAQGEGAEDIALSPVDPDTGQTLPGGLGDLWTARPWLTHLRQAAEADDAAPPLVMLAACLACTGSAIHHRYRVRLGPAHPLSDYWLLLGPPGAGKSAAISAMKGLLGQPFQKITRMVPASGEGILARLIGRPTPQEVAERKVDEQRAMEAAKEDLPYYSTLDSDPKVRFPQGLIVYDEGDLLRTLKSRRGQSLPAVVRSAWSGAELATDTGDPDRQRNVPAGAYSLGAIVGIQPALVDDLLADDGLGDRERWLVLPAVWSRSLQIGELPEHPGPLETPLLSALTAAPTQGEVAVKIDPAVVRQALVDRRLFAGRPSGEGEDYDKTRMELLAVINHGQHTTSHRLRLAGQIAALDGQDSDPSSWRIGLESWWLAGVILSISQQAREHAAEHSRLIAQERRHASRMGLVGDATAKEDALLERREDRIEQLVVAVAKSIGRLVVKQGGKLDRVQVANTVGSRAKSATAIGLERQDLIAQAVDHAVGQGWVLGESWGDAATGPKEWQAGPAQVEDTTPD